MSKLDKDVDSYFDGVDQAIKQIPKEGMSGEFPCPICKKGIVKWVRVSYNQHIRMGCSTPECIMLIQ